jgi:phosphoribosylformimino-5-aminoimidazole carboxamide ribotide isomerase
MLIIPAVDLYRGNVVRFLKGDPASSKIYSDDPLEVAASWKAQGARLLHLVDLSAALGEGENISFIEKIARGVDLELQVGGGIRDLERAKQLLSLGVERIILGTKGLDEIFLRQCLKEIGPQRLAVSVDTLKGQLAVEGWKKTTGFKDADFLTHLRAEGVQWVIYTDISRDGTLEGIDSQLIGRLEKFRDMKIIVSGGIATLDDVRAIKEKAPFVWGIITGKALYERTITLPEAQAVLSDQRS